MKKKTKIILIILGIIIALVASLAVWQRNNLKAVMYYLMYSEEELAQKSIENQKKLDEALKKIDMQAPRELTEEETKALESGEITLEEAVSLSLTPNADTAIAGTGGGNGVKPATPSASGDQEQSKMSKLVAELYVLKSSYMSKLDGLEAAGKKEYSQTPPNQRNATWKGQMISKYSGIISGWEAECDAKVEAVIGKIREEIKRTGGDMSVIKTIRSTYSHEKEIKKAEYLNTYLK